MPKGHARRIAADWQALYGHPVHYLETFVDPERFQGTCYRAANWQILGLTSGRGKDDLTHRPNRSRKLVLGLPLHADFRRCLGWGHEPAQEQNHPAGGGPHRATQRHRRAGPYRALAGGRARHPQGRGGHPGACHRGVGGKTTTLQRARHLLFGPRTETTDKVLGKDPADTTEPSTGGEAATAPNGEAPRKPPRQGHGRNGARAIA